MDFPFRSVFQCKNSVRLPFISLSRSITDNKSKWVIIEAMQKVFQRSVTSIRMILKYAGTNDPDVHFLLHASTQNRSESFFPFILLRIAGFSPSCFPRSTSSTCTISTNPAPRKGLRKKPKYFFVKLCDLENGPPRSLPKKKKRPIRS